MRLSSLEFFILDSCLFAVLLQTNRSSTAIQSHYYCKPIAVVLVFFEGNL